MMNADEALARLREGNQRYVDNTTRLAEINDWQRRAELAKGQEPFAIILGCSDSRVPAEIVFDQGLGDLFVIRVAGNVVAPSLVGSVEFAASQFGTPLVVVLGHSSCGAIRATLDQLASCSESPSPNLADIVERVRPAVAPLMERTPERPTAELMEEAVRANVHASVRGLTAESPILAERVRDGRLKVVGAEYDLASGEVSFLE